MDPPFGAGTLENGYDESTFDSKGRFWYVLLKEKILVLADCLQSLVSTFETIETTPAMTEAEDELSSGRCLIGCLVLDETFRSSEFDVY